jgi:hypothetical protein
MWFSSKCLFTILRRFGPKSGQTCTPVHNYVISTSLPSWRTDALGAAPQESIPHRHRAALPFAVAMLVFEEIRKAIVRRRRVQTSTITASPCP